ncbi:soluble guanylate cyclase 88E-like, partial [Symsagittifera roscoffensis]|uniref:soluble guanylate cyclase 88E-like n=1 Tax=Symsagittifera roscoffensis TaxID=84072 RepID=UPI00307C53A6
MYGLLLSSFADAIKETFGEEAWKQIREKAGVQYASFITHQVYSETLQPRLVNASTGILKQSADDVLMYQGTKFVEFCIKVGYDKFMRLLGRTISDFFNGLDNLHEYFRQYYPEMKRVSFIVSEESRNGLILHYRSKRKGYKMYVKGQILAVAKNLFNCEVKIEVKEERLMDETTFVAFDVFFDNVDYQKRTRPSSKVNRFGLQVKQDFLFSLFPFNIVFNRSMMITNVGNSLFEIMPDILNQPVDDIFKLVKPMASLTWETLVAYENNSFELETIDCLVPRRLSGETSSITSGGPIPDEDPNQKTTLGKLLLRGQMLLVDDWDQFMFICTPVLTNVKQMMKCCLYINDLSLHDSTRAAVLAGSQQNNQLAAALQKAKEQSASLQDTVKRVDLERNRIAKFLQEMMPKEVADRIKKGEPTLSMTQSHSAVSILFTHIVNFPAYINESKPMNVIELLNLLFSVYDQLVKTHNAYKVETVGDTYMVACGAPTKFDKHAEEAADLALHMLHVATFIIPPGHTSPIEIEIGIHSGPCSTGVVGSRCPRYCFFGDTVNTASRMCSYAGASKIQISSPTQQLLDPCGEYIFESRGKLSIKGKGDMNTYYLLGTRKCLQYLEQLKVIVIQCMGKQQENQFQQILGKRTLDSTESLLQEPNKTSMMAKRASGINAQAILKEEGRSNEGVKTKESVGSIPNSTPADDPHNTTKPGTPPMTKEESSILSKNNETSKQPNEADNVPEKCALKEDKMTVSGKMIRTETEVHVNRDNSKDTVDPKSKDGINEIKANGQCTGPNLEAEVKNEKHASPP